MNINFDDNLTVAERQLHLQTHFSSDRGVIISILFDHGRILARKELAAQNGYVGEALSRAVLDTHQAHVDNIRFINNIRAQVLQLKHLPSLFRMARLYLSWGLTGEAQNIMKYATRLKGDPIKIKIIQAKILSLQNAFEQLIQLFAEINVNTLDHWELIQLLGEAYCRMNYLDHAYAMFTHTTQEHHAKSQFLAALCILKEIEKSESTSYIFGNDNGLDLCASHFKRAIDLLHESEMLDFEYIIQEIRLQNYHSAIEELEKKIQYMGDEEDMSTHDMFFLRYLFDAEYRDPALVDQYIDQTKELVGSVNTQDSVHACLGMAFMMQSLEACHSGMNQFRQIRGIGDIVHPCLHSCHEIQLKTADLLKYCLKTMD